MNCELCGNDIGDTIVLLPIKKPNGRLSIMTCLGCAEKSSAYCKKHKRPHIGFADDKTTACLICVEEGVSEKKSEAESIFSRVKEALSLEELEDLEEWTRVSSFVTGDSQAISVLRIIATKAARLRVSIEEIVKQIIQTKSMDPVLPKGFI